MKRDMLREQVLGGQVVEGKAGCDGGGGGKRPPFPLTCKTVVSQSVPRRKLDRCENVSSEEGEV